MHAKRPRYCSSELKFTWTVQTQRKQMHAWGEENRPGDEEAAATLKAWWLLGLCSSVSNLFLLFCICVCFLLFLSSASSSLSLLVPAFSSPLFCRFYLQKKWSKDRKSVPASSLFLLSFFHLFFSLLSLLLPAFLVSQQRKDEGIRNSICSLRFFSPNCLPLLRFLSMFCCPPSLSSLGQQPRLLYSLYMALFRKQILH